MNRAPAEVQDGRNGIDRRRMKQRVPAPQQGLKQEWRGRCQETFSQTFWWAPSFLGWQLPYFVRSRGFDMTDTYLTGGELTALTMVYWTREPFQFGRPECLQMAIDGLLAKEMIWPSVGPGTEEWWELTPKGKCLMDAINAIPEPVNQWVIP